jgi:hypothetical protein
MESARLNRSKLLNNFLPVLLFTFIAIAVMGYHPGIEDDGVYLAAVKADLNPDLFPHDANFFRLQMQASVFDGWMAHFVRLTHIPVGWAELLWQFLALFFILWAAREILRHLFSDLRAIWAGVALLAAMFTLPVAGTALYIADQHLHPRALATALILLGVTRILKSKAWQSLPFLFIAFLIHPIMGALGCSFCFFLVLSKLDLKLLRLPSTSISIALALPLSWIFQPPTPIWHKALETRTYYFLNRWKWYEWLGAIAPILLFCILWRIARKYGDEKLSRFAFAVFTYAIFQQVVAFLMVTPSAFIRLLPLQPMRYLQLVYIFLVLIGGALAGRYMLRSNFWRWALFLIVINGSMFYVQRQVFPATAHFELPGFDTGNSWLQAFDWVRSNTPMDAYFAMDPRYLAADGEDTHGFRAIAERSQMADAIKDTAVVTQVPELGPEWERQTTALEGWKNFHLADFERLKREFKVDWVLVDPAQAAGLDCRWHNEKLAVCKIP